MFYYTKIQTIQTANKVNILFNCNFNINFSVWINDIYRWYQEYLSKEDTP